MSNNYFAGSLDNLRYHWEDSNRALKFREGQTRTRAAKYIVKYHETNIHNNSWLDTGVGAGFIQSLVDESIIPCLHVGLDFSEIMLRSHIAPYGERVLGSTFTLPFRKHSFSFVTNIFSLSDYPTINKAFSELFRTLCPGGIMSHADYAKSDEYWEARKIAHGEKIDNSSTIIGNINLRTLENIRKEIPDHHEILFQSLIEYKVNSDLISAPFKLPNIITRRFLFTEVRKQNLN